MAEWLDIYDRQGRATGRIQARDGTEGGGDNCYLTVRVWVRDAAGRILATLRQRDRFWYPDCWETPGGFARAGEGAFAAACRELIEETGLVPDEKGWLLLGEHVYDDSFSGCPYHAMVVSYLAQLAEERPVITLQTAEVAEYLWVPGEEYPALLTRRRMEPFTSTSFAAHWERILAGIPLRKQ